MTQPRPNPAKILQFDVRGRVVGARRADGRTSVPARLLSAFLGILLATLGLGLLALIPLTLAQVPKQWAFALLLLGLLGTGLLFATYGLDLVARGILGRQPGRRFWAAVETHLVGRPGRLLFGLVVLGFVLLKILNVFSEKGPERFEGLFFLASGLLHIFCHELGHLSAAGAAGYRPRWLAVGPLALRFEGRRPHLTRSRSWLDLVGGYAAYTPVGRTWNKDFLVITAGPLANLGLAAAALDLWGWPGGPSSVFAVFLRTFVGLGFAIGLLNLAPLPRTPDGFALDGRELLDLFRRPKA